MAAMMILMLPFGMVAIPGPGMMMAVSMAMAMSVTSPRRRGHGKERCDEYAFEYPHDCSP